MKTGILDLSELDQNYTVVVQIRHQPPGVFHQVTLRPDKIKQTMRECSLGHHHKSAIIMVGETPGDQATGWQFPENIHVLAILGIASPSSDPNKWDCKPVFE